MADMGLGQPMPDDPTDPSPNDHSDLTDQQVEDLLSGKAPTPPPVAEQPDTIEEVSTSEDDAPPPEKTEAAPLEEPEVEAPPLSAEDRLASLEATLRVEKLEREKAEAIAERERYLHSRNAGELGYLKKLLAERQSQDAPAYDAPAQTPDELSDIRNDIAAMKSERSAQAIAEEVNDFQRTYPEAAKDEAAMTEIAQRKLPEYLPLINGADPKMARTIVRSLLKESYAELRIAKEQAAAKVSYDQAAKLKARKVAATPAPTSRTAPLRAAPKSVDDMTDAEVDALADAYVRSRA